MTLFEQIQNVLEAEIPVVPIGDVPRGPIAMLRAGGIVEGRRLIEVIVVVPYTLPDAELQLAIETDRVYELLRPHLVDIVASRIPDYTVTRSSRRTATDSQYPAMLLSGAGRNAGLGSGS